MKIFVTGASGFTGHFFTAAAEASGHNIIPLQSDLTNKSAIASEVLQAKPDAVVHLAAITFVEHPDKSDFYKVNVIGTMNLLEALANLPIKPSMVLLASSANVYGNFNLSPITEKEPVFPVNHYATSKLAMEYMALSFLDRLPIIITRPFNYTGPGQGGKFLIPKLINHFALRAPSIELGNLHVEREFNDVRMVCDTYLALLDKGKSGEIYNVCSGQSYGLQQVIDMLVEITGHSMDVRVNPALIRSNEVHRLCGNPAKLLMCVDAFLQPALHETLRWMLDARLNN